MIDRLVRIFTLPPDLFKEQEEYDSAWQQASECGESDPVEVDGQFVIVKQVGNKAGRVTVPAPTE